MSRKQKISHEWATFRYLEAGRHQQRHRPRYCNAKQDATLQAKSLFIRSCRRSPCHWHN